ncbi:hypothetical protein ACN38_g262 [Penicillium nordicum]|uniref:Uncharacterized protein n=1 Tax=Penicillium nordicum TaxID=229535 RepID=A0A0M9WKW0_9EURO|nr:hypothetical protein ACN38_g262 [Penicillium nordicum]
MSPERRVPGADAFSRFVFVRYCWNSDFSIGTVGLNPFRILVLASIFQPSVIYHGIAIVKYTAPEPPQPHNIIMHHNNATLNKTMFCSINMPTTDEVIINLPAAVNLPATDDANYDHVI